MGEAAEGRRRAGIESGLGIGEVITSDGAERAIDLVVIISVFCSVGVARSDDAQAIRR